MRRSRSFLIIITLGSLTIILVIVVLKAVANSQDSHGNESPLQPSSNATASPAQPNSQIPQHTLSPGSKAGSDSPQTSPKGRVNVQSLPPAIIPSTPQEAPAPRQAVPTPTMAAALTPQNKVVPPETQAPPTSTPACSPAAGDTISDPDYIAVPHQDSPEPCRSGIGIIERQVLE